MQATPWTEEGTVTRVEENREMVAWGQCVLTSDGDPLSEVLRLGLERLMGVVQTTYVNAERYERAEGGRTWRSGCRIWTPKTWAGELEGTELRT